jgi:hypothetical protein
MVTLRVVARNYFSMELLISFTSAGHSFYDGYPFANKLNLLNLLRSIVLIGSEYLFIAVALEGVI